MNQQLVALDAVSKPKASAMRLKNEPPNARLRFGRELSKRLLAICATVGITFASFALAQSQDRPIAATVANQNIAIERVESLLEQTLDNRTFDEPARELLKAKALDQLVGQLLVVEYFRGQGKLASDEDVQLELERMENELAAVERTLEQSLAEQHLTRDEFVEQLRFRLSWTRYLDAMLTADNLQKHFERFRRELDGSQAHVAQILIKCDVDDPHSWNAALEQATQIRSEIVEERLKWSDAVAQYSQAASRDAGGDLGWIGRWAPMPEAFSQAAFQLEPGQISAPVRTRFGIHLIRCESIEPGGSMWNEVEADVRRHATQYIFDWIVDRQRPVTPPAYTGLFPYWDASEGKVVPANK
jgi:peptidyl-prolyl cis-trans isomerase SurA